MFSGVKPILRLSKTNRDLVIQHDGFTGEGMLRMAMTTNFPVTITTAEEFRLLEQEKREAELRRSALSIEPNQLAAHGMVNWDESKRLHSMSRTIGFVSVVVSLLGLGILVVKRRLTR